jgi:DNA primase
MIPIRDHQGRVVAFTARQTDRTPGGRSGARRQVRQFPGDSHLHQGQSPLQSGPRPHRRRRRAGPSCSSKASLTPSAAGAPASRPPSPRRAPPSPTSQLVLLRRYHIRRWNVSSTRDTAGQKAALRLLPMAVLKAGSGSPFSAALWRLRKNSTPTCCFWRRDSPPMRKLPRELAESTIAYACPRGPAAARWLPVRGRAAVPRRPGAGMEIIAASPSEAEPWPAPSSSQEDCRRPVCSSRTPIMQQRFSPR